MNIRINDEHRTELLSQINKAVDRYIIGKAKDIGWPLKKCSIKIWVLIAALSLTNLIWFFIFLNLH